MVALAFEVAVVGRVLLLAVGLAGRCGLQVLSVSLFEKVPVLEAFSHPNPTVGNSPFCNQLSLFD